MRQSPTLLFIPGSWHKPVCYDILISRLREQGGLRCISITLPSTNGDPAATFKDDLDTARNAIEFETNEDRDVVVIAHSYGGIVGNSAIKGFAKKDNPKSSDSPESSRKGHVIGLILIASGFALTGLSFMDPLFGHPPPAWRVNATTGYAEIVADPRQMFYHDLSPEDAEYWTSQLTTQSLKSLFEGGEFVYSGWKDVPSWYIGTVEDQGLPVVVQRMQVGMARTMGGRVEHRELQTSHSPFLSQPENTADIIMEAVEAFMVAGAGMAPQPRSTTTGVVPAPKLFYPLTWLRFGIPLIFGRFLGRTYMVFSWIRSFWKA
ncbi:Alpha/beta hydrolase family-domain-containing protein [Plectosphaerella plurivora]|uniref:Alpha/beta hydrolase family-domain-containing protein n=1 Tax=Plectosphaerella plurivora TaxID=936078 RepID=A0A9P8V6T5_9PEZI|nr:Alpha/beta hydrolase family-domain-containing protein [Plectosphaerella plurivora]